MNGIKPLAWSMPEAAIRLGIGRTKLYALAEAGIIPTVTIGSRRLVRDADLVAYINSLQPDPPSVASHGRARIGKVNWSAPERREALAELKAKATPVVIDPADRVQS